MSLYYVFVEQKYYYYYYRGMYALAGNNDKTQCIILMACIRNRSPKIS